MSKIIEWLKLNLTPNRVAALSTFAAALATLLLDLEGQFHTTKTGVALIAIAALATKASVVLKYLAGSQAWDLIQAGVHPKTGTPIPPQVDPLALWSQLPEGDPPSDLSPTVPPGLAGDVPKAVAEGREFGDDDPTPTPKRRRRSS